LELSVQAAIKSHCKNRGESSTRSFVNQVPTKVLRLFVKLLIETTLLEESMITAAELETSASLNKEKSGDRVCTSRLAMQKESGILPRAVEEVAARPDDAEAKAEDWDNWLVTSFDSPCGKEPLVCRGEYEEEKHAPLFNALRKLLIRRYRRKVLRSYLAFMQSAHFKGKVTFVIPGTGKCSGRTIKIARWSVIPLKFKKLKGKLWNLHRDMEVGRDAIERAANSSWWDWDAGSTLFF